MLYRKETERDRERNAMTILLLSINAKGEPFINEAFDTIGQFNSSYG
jgi:hypothetical protein